MILSNVQIQYDSLNDCTNKTGSVEWSGSMDVDEERRTSSATF